MKPAIEWLQDLEPGYRERALANAERFPYHPDKLVETIEDAVLSAFRWKLTDEGSFFWNDVYTALMRELTIPPLPTDE